MTHNLPDRDDAPWLDTTYDGFKIQEQSFYDKLCELLETQFGDTVVCDQMADRIYDLVLMSLPKEQSAAGSQNAYVECAVEGFNDAIKQIKGKLR